MRKIEIKYNKSQAPTKRFPYSVTLIEYGEEGEFIKKEVIEIKSKSISAAVAMLSVIKKRECFSFEITKVEKLL